MIPEVIVQIFNSCTELAISIRIPTKEAKREIETYLVTKEAEINK